MTGDGPGARATRAAPPLQSINDEDIIGRAAGGGLDPSCWTGQPFRKDAAFRYPAFGDGSVTLVHPEWSDGNRRSRQIRARIG